MTVAAARRKLDAAAVLGAPVVDADGTVRGSLDADILIGVDGDTRVGDLALDEVLAAPDDALDDVLGMLADARRSWVPVVAGAKLAGVVSAKDILATYRRGLAANVHRVSMVGSSGSIVEAEVAATSVLSGRSVKEAPWPRDCVLVSVSRGDRMIVPRGEVVLQAGDRVSVFTAPEARVQLEALLASRLQEGVPAE